MRRKLLTASLLGAMAVAGAVALKHSLAAKPQTGEPVLTKVGTTQLPIGQVVLFSSGVGYFQREGEVQGNARVDLSFPVQDINDLLKSMVLQDLGGGHVSAVNYDSQAPVEKTLRSFAINLTNNPTFGQILNQARGEKVEAILQQTQAAQPGNLTGVIMGIEKKREAAGKEVVEAEFLNLWCAEGMRSVKMSDVQRVRFLNPVMDSEVKKALEVLALSHDTQKKSVSLNFSGDGKRAVKVGYVVENPIWKTSYRLDPGQEGQGVLARLGGGREHAGRGLEQRADGPGQRPADFLPDGPVSTAVRHPAGGRAGAVRLAAAADLPGRDGRHGPGRGQAPRSAGFGGFPASRPDARCGKQGRSGDAMRRTSAFAWPTQMRQKRGPRTASTRARASAPRRSRTQLGDFFQYLIENPVNLPRQKSAMLPIVNQDVEGTKVSIYNQSRPRQVPAAGPPLQEQHPAAPDARPDHRL